MTSIRIQKRTNTGFTIVELLIVIVVIAILAAIVIVGYNGIRSKAIEASLKHDLDSAAKILENDRSINGVFPATAAAAQSGRGLIPSGSNTYAYSLKPYGYCVSAANPGLSTTYSVRSNTNQIQSGNCDSRVTTVAGQDGSGTAYVDGNGSTARLSCMYGLALSNNGDMYVGSDSNLAHIRRVTQTGDVSTFATLSDTRPYCPAAHVVDSLGYVYFTVSTSGSAHQVWRVSPAGVVSSFAGAATSGSTNGQGSAARFSFPRGLAIDKQDNIYVADTGNNRIRRIDPSANVTTIVGTGTNGFLDGPALSAQLSGPNVVTFDSTGNMYIGESTRIRKLTASTGNVSLVAGSGAWGYQDGPGVNAQFNDVSFLVADKDGFLYSADYDGAYIRKIALDNSVSTIIGSPFYGSVDGSGTTARFRAIHGMKLDPSGILWLADGNTIRKVEL